ncbi:MAG: hypothetical protein WC718_00675 [Phycisphaerales bacterium]|jgi:hypothetical protein
MAAHHLTRWLFAGLAAAAPILSSPIAMAQGDRASAPAPAPTREIDPTIAAALDAVRAAYSNRAFTERESVTLRPLQGTPRTSRLSLLVDRGDGSLLHPPRVVLKLGVQLHVEALGTRLRAINLQNKQLMYEATLSGPPSPDTLAKVIPASPLPQLAWALSPDAPADAATLRVDPVGTVTWLRADKHPEENETVLQGMSPRGPVEMSIDSRSGRLLRLLAAISDDGTRIEIRTEPADAPDAQGWDIDPAGRTLVKSISELREAPADAQLGARAPGLGLMTPTLTAWDLGGSLREMLAHPTQAGSGPAYIALVMFKASARDAAASDAALETTVAVNAIKKELDRRRQQGKPSTIRLLVRPVAVLELSDVQPAGIKALEETWSHAGEALLWTSGGQGLLDRFSPQASVVVALIDPDQILAGKLVVDPANHGADAVATDFRAIVKDLALPEAEPETPDGAAGPK